MGGRGSAWCRHGWGGRFKASGSSLPTAFIFLVLDCGSHLLTGGAILVDSIHDGNVHELKLAH